MGEYTDPNVLAAKIDYEGWPDALEWFINDTFEDQELQGIVDDGIRAYDELEDVYKRLKTKFKSMGVEFS